MILNTFTETSKASNTFKKKDVMRMISSVILYKDVFLKQRAELRAMLPFLWLFCQKHEFTEGNLRRKHDRSLFILYRKF